MSDLKKKYTDEERLALAAKLDRELDEFIDNLPRKQSNGDGDEKIVPPENWLEEFEKHPFFMKKVPEAGEEMHPLYEGLQQLKYDPNENTPQELALAYKEDGNFNFKHRNYRLAIIAYTEGIKTDCNDSKVLATLHNNRAASHYFLENYRSALRDCETALKFDPEYRKARVRAAQCCLNTEKFTEGLKHCDLLLDGERSIEVQELRGSLVKRQAQSLRDARKRDKYLKKLKDTDLKLLQTLNERQLVFDTDDLTIEKLTPHYDQLRQFRVTLDSRSSSPTTLTLRWPVLLMYPEHSVSEFIQGFPDSSTFAEQLEPMFCERPAWDTERKYKMASLNVYFMTNTMRVRRVSMREPLAKILQSPRLIIRQGTPSFFVLVKDTSAEREFLAKCHAR